MRIGGLEKCSLIDYAPHISCVVFTKGCNFHCPYCHNPELVSPDDTGETLPETEVFAFLEQRRNYLDGVVISGGEPTLQPDLPEFCRQVKSMGYFVKLDTNGTRPDVLRHLLSKNRLDYIAMDIKTDPEHYAPLIAADCDPAVIRESIRLVLNSGIRHEFRTTCVKPLINETVLRTIAGLVNGAWMYALQKPQTRSVLSPAFFNGINRNLEDNEFSAFQSILSESVHRCIIR